MLLAGDIGGTKTNLAIFSATAGLRSPLAEATYPSQCYPSLEALVLKFLSGIQLPIERACFGVAGPVVNGRVQTTNIPWTMDEESLRRALAVESVRLLNDLEAIGTALPFLEAEDLHTLRTGEPVAGAPMAVVAPGTGLGEAFLTRDGDGYTTHPSEGGHTAFGPTSDLQMDLLRHLRSRMSHVSYERVCSGGLGIPNIYRFLKDGGRAVEPDELAKQLAESRDPTPVIVETALEELGSGSICALTLETFVGILGDEAGNLALTVMATGGVYLAGGIPPRILPALDTGSFLRAFQNKGRLSPVLEKIPVHVVLHPKVALLGAASCGLEL